MVTSCPPRKNRNRNIVRIYDYTSEHMFYTYNRRHIVRCLVFEELEPINTGHIGFNIYNSQCDGFGHFMEFENPHLVEYNDFRQTTFTCKFEQDLTEFNPVLIQFFGLIVLRHTLNSTVVPVPTRIIDCWFNLNQNNNTEVEKYSVNDIIYSFDISNSAITVKTISPLYCTYNDV